MGASDKSGAVTRAGGNGGILTKEGSAKPERTLYTNGTGQLVAHVCWASYVRPMAKPQQARNQTKAARTHQGRARRVDAGEVEEARFPDE